MNFKDLLLRAKDGDQQAKEEIFLMYRPLLFKESCVNGIFDEDLFQELMMSSGFPFSSEFHFLFPPFLMIYPQSLSAFGRKKAGTTILVKSSMFA